MSHIFRLGDTAVLAATTSATTMSGTFGSGVTAARLHSNTGCHFAIGKAPTATTNSPYLGAYVEAVYRVSPGEKVSVIRHTTSGILSVSEAS